MCCICVSLIVRSWLLAVGGWFAVLFAWVFLFGWLVLFLDVFFLSLFLAFKPAGPRRKSGQGGGEEPECYKIQWFARLKAQTRDFRHFDCE